MNELVFLANREVYTDTFIIAGRTKNEHESIKRLVKTHKKRFLKYGTLPISNRESNGGRPEQYYKLNETQAMILLTMLKNNDIVLDFKCALVEDFVKMRKLLLERNTLERQQAREQLKPIRCELMEVIQEKEPDNIWAYKKYTDLAYKSVTGKISRVLRKERGAAKKDKAIDYMTADEIQNIAKKEIQIAVLREMDMDYEQIKALVLPQERGLIEKFNIQLQQQVQ